MAGNSGLILINVKEKQDYKSVAKMSLNANYSRPAKSTRLLVSQKKRDIWGTSLIWGMLRVIKRDEEICRPVT